MREFVPEVTQSLEVKEGRVETCRPTALRIEPRQGLVSKAMQSVGSTSLVSLPLGNGGSFSRRRRTGPRQVWGRFCVVGWAVACPPPAE